MDAHTDLEHVHICLAAALACCEHAAAQLGGARKNRANELAGMIGAVVARERLRTCVEGDVQAGLRHD